MSNFPARQPIWNLKLSATFKLLLNTMAYGANMCIDDVLNFRHLLLEALSAAESIEIESMVLPGEPVQTLAVRMTVYGTFKYEAYIPHVFADLLAQEIYEVIQGVYAIPAEVSQVLLADVLWNSIRAYDPGADAYNHIDEYLAVNQEWKLNFEGTKIQFYTPSNREAIPSAWISVNTYDVARQQDNHARQQRIQANIMADTVELPATPNPQ